MEMTYDAGADAAYMTLLEAPAPGSMVRQVVVDLDLGEGVTVVIDISKDSVVGGIEFIGARSAFSEEQLASMVRVD